MWTKSSNVSMFVAVPATSLSGMVASCDAYGLPVYCEVIRLFVSLLICYVHSSVPVRRKNLDFG